MRKKNKASPEIAHNYIVYILPGVSMELFLQSVLFKLLFKAFFHFIDFVNNEQL